jgi:hypothetical protein
LAPTQVRGQLRIVGPPLHHKRCFLTSCSRRFLREGRPLAREHCESVHLTDSAAAGCKIIRLTQCRNGLIELCRSVGRNMRVAARSMHGYTRVIHHGVTLGNGSAACRCQHRKHENGFCP